MFMAKHVDIRSGNPSVSLLGMDVLWNPPEGVFVESIKFCKLVRRVRARVIGTSRINIKLAHTKSVMNRIARFIVFPLERR